HFAIAQFPGPRGQRQAPFLLRLRSAEKLPVGKLMTGSVELVQQLRRRAREAARTVAGRKQRPRLLVWLRRLRVQPQQLRRSKFARALPCSPTMPRAALRSR